MVWPMSGDEVAVGRECQGELQSRSLATLNVEWGYCSFPYFTLACFRMGMSRSGVFPVRKFGGHAYVRGYRSGPLHLERVNFSAANIPHDEWRVIWTKTAPLSTSLKHERSSYVLEANYLLDLPATCRNTIHRRTVLSGIFEINVFAIARPVGILQDIT